MTPNELAAELGISPKALRDHLRSEYGRLSDRSQTRWHLSPTQIELARARFQHCGRNRSGISTSKDSGKKAESEHPHTSVPEPGPGWNELRSLPRHHSADLNPSEIPTTPGLYLWFHESECVYLGIAGNLKERISAHRSTARDLSGSTLRSWVAVELLGVERKITRLRPSIMTNEQVQIVNAWLAACEIAWITTDSRESAKILEDRLLGEHRPRFNAG